MTSSLFGSICLTSTTKLSERKLVVWSASSGAGFSRNRQEKEADVSAELLQKEFGLGFYHFRTPLCIIWFRTTAPIALRCRQGRYGAAKITT